MTQSVYREQITAKALYLLKYPNKDYHVLPDDVKRAYESDAQRLMAIQDQAGLMRDPDMGYSYGHVVEWHVRLAVMDTSDRDQQHKKVEEAFNSALKSIWEGCRQNGVKVVILAHNSVYTYGI